MRQGSARRMRWDSGVWSAWDDGQGAQGQRKLQPFEQGEVTDTGPLKAEIDMIIRSSWIFIYRAHNWRSTNAGVVRPADQRLFIRCGRN